MSLEEGLPSMFVAATHRSLRALVYERLRELIIDGKLPPGHRLVEREIANELGVSRIPLREAVRQLEIEGLVEMNPRRSAVVSTPTASAVENLFDVRESLEVLAARLAARRATAADLQRLRDLLLAAEEATGRGSEDEIAAANSAFHAEIIVVARNELLASLMEPLNGQLRRLFRLTSNRDPVEQCREHRLLADAIAAHDEETASRLALDHVVKGRAPTLARLRELNLS